MTKRDTRPLDDDAGPLTGSFVASGLACFSRRRLSQDNLERLAEFLALKVRPGLLITLSGDLGVGKSTFARALIRAVLEAPETDNPSPTFALIQSYETRRTQLHHVDLYRLSAPDEIDELGLDEALESGTVLIEWPERAAGNLPGDRIEIAICETADSGLLRDVTMTARSPETSRLLARADVLERLASGFASDAGGLASVRYLQGDASARAYARLGLGNGQSVILMDSPPMPDGPPVRAGQPYSRIAHLAEHVGPFVALSKLLDAAGLSVPRVRAADLEGGALVVDDLGDQVYSLLVRAIDEGEAPDLPDGHDTPDCHHTPGMAELWRTAVEALVHLRIASPSPRILFGEPQQVHDLPRFDAAALSIEVDLLLDWAWPALFGAPAAEAMRASYTAAWQPVFDRLLALEDGIVLRDYHSPNLIWLAGRSGHRRVGIIDFQDAMRGHWSYDLAALLQDARVDVPEALARDLFEHYCRQLAAHGIAEDAAELRFAYAAFGAQRAAKIIGIFTRLALRDGKFADLAHLPRMWRLLERNLEAPQLAGLRDWFNAHIPPARRNIPDIKSR